MGCGIIRAQLRGLVRLDSLVKYYELPLEVRVCAYIGTRIKSTNPSGLLLSAMVRGSPGSRASDNNGSALQQNVPCRWVCASRECASQPFIGCCLCRNIKVTYLSRMKGATTNCETNEWPSLWVWLTSFDNLLLFSVTFVRASFPNPVEKV